MSRRMALLISTALTAFVLVVGVALAVRLGVPTASMAGAPVPREESAPRQQPAEPAGEAVAVSEPWAGSGPAISRQQAAELAVQAIGGGRVSSVELEREPGRTVYEVKVGRTEVYVDASSGEVFVEDDDD